MKISQVIISGKSPGKQKITFIAQKTLPHLRYASCINLLCSQFRENPQHAVHLIYSDIYIITRNCQYLLEIRPFPEMATTSPPVASPARGFFKQNTQVNLKKSRGMPNIKKLKLKAKYQKVVGCFCEQTTWVTPHRS